MQKGLQDVRRLCLRRVLSAVRCARVCLGLRGDDVITPPGRGCSAATTTHTGWPLYGFISTRAAGMDGLRCEQPE